ncbi:hypothetical protein NA57DRAFT_58583 [Rhizodiscina lignyota]|uniref:DUF7726 domain-containing protein n=1 Tax=Rhizodiscina lignyota TaxID=1504668 RepID=A0A9P4M4D5_9PEZI|nr:hypothetical protein NA57DRAFT_58583 [Rhizodiscina lignyota]
MSQRGVFAGAGTDTYTKAWAFFKKREVQGKGLPRKKTKTAAAGNKSTGPKIPGSESTGGKDLSNTHLDGEDTDSVPVLDTCDEIRKKISAHLKRDDVIQAAFLRDLQAQFHTARAPKRIQSVMLDRFRHMKGASAGNTSSIYYSSYVFFEKLRVAEGIKKSKHRLDMENIYGNKGMNITDDSSRGFWAPIGAGVVEDKYGRVTLR